MGTLRSAPWLVFCDVTTVMQTLDVCCEYMFSAQQLCVWFLCNVVPAQCPGATETIRILSVLGLLKLEDNTGQPGAQVVVLSRL